MCIQHGENSVDKLQFAKEENKLDFGISEDIKKILKSVLGMKDDSSDEEVEIIKEEL